MTAARTRPAATGTAPGTGAGPWRSAPASGWCDAAKGVP
ncbi:protein of unassigned function [Methylobacterium oryzae CBMB20]|uniref:Protein of unassigned function n=1 Tax=Methylobacterium oryzae CBMB20 TaxID=693986 RepID=A0A089NXE7_9HYPH|nr:protein of unassigned function [Methylobacterium oryzae CBMB20]